MSTLRLQALERRLARVLGHVRQLIEAEGGEGCLGNRRPITSLRGVLPATTILAALRHDPPINTVGELTRLIEACLAPAVKQSLPGSANSPAPGADAAEQPK